MASRISTRSSATREPMASQAKPSSSSQSRRLSQLSQASRKRTTRSTRSQSRDNSDNEAGTTVRQKAQRDVHQGNVDSLNGSGGAKQSRGKEKHGVNEGNVKQSDLPIVNEDQEREAEAEVEAEVAGEAEAEAETEAEAKAEDPAGKELGRVVNDALNYSSHEASRPSMQSLGAASNMSGTTALASHSAGDDMTLDIAAVIENLPDLYRPASQVLKLLLPSENFTDEEFRNFLQSLRSPKSHSYPRLRRLWQTLKVWEDLYGLDPFIDTDLIRKELFRDQSKGTLSASLDAVLHTANMASFLHTLYQLREDDQHFFETITSISERFPHNFISQYEIDSSHKRYSLIEEETFKAALCLHIQTAIHLLSSSHDPVDGSESPEDIQSPRDILACHFFELKVGPDDTQSFHFDGRRYSEYRRIMGSKLTDEQAKAMREAMQSFNSFVDKHEQDLLYDFLREIKSMYPWEEFLSILTRWARTCTAEISDMIVNQGGVDEIVDKLTTNIENRGAQGLIIIEPTPAAAQAQQKSDTLTFRPVEKAVVQASSNSSLYKGRKSVAMLLRPSSTRASNTVSAQDMNRSISPAQPSAAQQPAPLIPAGQASKPRSRHSEPSRAVPTFIVHESVDQLALDDEEDHYRGTHQGPSASEYATRYFELQKSNEKENEPLEIQRPINNNGNGASKQRFLDRQAKAHRMEWSQTENSSAESQRQPLLPQTTSQQEPAVDEDDSFTDDNVSEDAGFQDDARPLEASSRRREELPPAAPAAYEHAVSWRRKRLRFDDDKEKEGESASYAASSSSKRRRVSRFPDVRRLHSNADAQLQTSARAASSSEPHIAADEEAEENDDEEEEEVRRPEAAAVQRTQRRARAAAGYAARDIDFHADPDPDAAAAATAEAIGAMTQSAVRETARHRYMERSLTAAARSARPPPQRRVHWSDAEAYRLQELIKAYGCSWARIYEEGRGGWDKKRWVMAKNDARAQMALRDKARNMKTDILIAGLPLPTNFDGVVLSEKERDKCRRANINPYRVEGETPGMEAIDEFGEPFLDDM